MSKQDKQVEIEKEEKEILNMLKGAVKNYDEQNKNNWLTQEEISVKKLKWEKTKEEMKWK